jgi:hypothetical protein
LHAPALAFFHIPVPEVRGLRYTGFKGEYQEEVACSTVNSGVLGTLASMGDVKAVFLGHDHLNDFCGDLSVMAVALATMPTEDRTGQGELG